MSYYKPVCPHWTRCACDLECAAGYMRSHAKPTRYPYQPLPVWGWAVAAVIAAFLIYMA